MLKERLDAAYAVRDAYLPLKRKTAEIALEASECLATMHGQRRRLNMKPGEGAKALAAIARGAALLSEAEQLFASAHPQLGQLIVDTGLSAFYAYGDDDTPPPHRTGIGRLKAA